MLYYVYIVSCVDNSFYTGYTKNVELRMKLHNEGKGSRYTRMHKPKKLVYVERIWSRSDAMRRERQIKRLNRHQKMVLIESAKSTSEKKVLVNSH